MTDDNKGRENLSRRKVLGALGASGAVVGLGGLGTYAQFTDTEEDTITISAGGIDLLVRSGASYNGQDISNFDAGQFEPEDLPANVEGFEETGALGLDFNLTDVKPGDYGCLSFGIEVTDNPAWVAACLGYENNIDGETFEPEVEADDDVNSSDVNASPLSVDGQGEIPENMLVIPFYGGEMPPSEPFDPCIFFDEENETFDASAYEGSGVVGTPTPFWDNSENGLTPATLYDATRFQALDTQTWDGNGDFETYDVEDSIVVGEGCTFLNGALNDSNQKGAAPVQPGDEFRFGWDWHIPFDVGNEMQGDELTLQLGFVAGQTRHTDSAQLSNVFDPGQNLPGSN